MIPGSAVRDCQMRHISMDLLSPYPSAPESCRALSMEWVKCLKGVSWAKVQARSRIKVNVPQLPNALAIRTQRRTNKRNRL
jgi:hypothetical protein